MLVVSRLLIHTVASVDDLVRHTLRALRETLVEKKNEKDREPDALDIVRMKGRVANTYPQICTSRIAVVDTSGFCCESVISYPPSHSSPRTTALSVLLVLRASASSLVTACSRTLTRSTKNPLVRAEVMPWRWMRTSIGVQETQYSKYQQQQLTGELTENVCGNRVSFVCCWASGPWALSH